MREISIREFSYIIQDENGVEADRLDICHVNAKAWDYLENYAYSHEKENRFIRVASYMGKKAFQVVNFVGVITIPDNVHLEILPKISDDSSVSEIIRTRELLLKMLRVVDDLHFIQTTDADLNLFDKPLPEILINRFLHNLADVVRKGIRKDYERVEAEERFLKGRLLVSQQLNQPVGKQHLFRIAYDIFSENRAENRLIHSALVQVSKWSQSDANQKLARELRFAFNDVPKSFDYKTDFGLWRHSRDMISYRALLPWVKLILNQQSPFTVKGSDAGISFLFPMESLFEKYVFRILQRTIYEKFPSYVIKNQVQSKYLSDNPKAFLLKPDLAIYKDEKMISILDTKWKLIDQNAQYENGKNDPKSSVSQSDMYQMFAYSHKYMGGQGKTVLIYPKWLKFSDMIDNTKQIEFELNENLTISIFPFDLESSDATSLVSNIIK
jgi:5-methylcytosine-specific restriction enzyme subunit McrC